MARIIQNKNVQTKSGLNISGGVLTTASTDGYDFGFKISDKSEMSRLLDQILLKAEDNSLRLIY